MFPRTAFYARGHETLTLNNRVNNALNITGGLTGNPPMNSPYYDDNRYEDPSLKHPSTLDEPSPSNQQYPPPPLAQQLQLYRRDRDQQQQDKDTLLNEVIRESDRLIHPLGHKHKNRHSRPPQPQDGTDSLVRRNDLLQTQALQWTQAETEKIVQQLEFLTEKVCEDRDRFPKEVVSQHLRTLQALIQQDNQCNLQTGPRKDQSRLCRDDPLLAQISDSIRELQLVDLSKLSRLMKAARQSEELLTGRDLLLLSGPSGCGKTTTLHFLAGTDFEEVEIEGFSHLDPRKCCDPNVARYATSCCHSGVTRTLQTAQVIVDGKKYFVCDTPALDTLDSIEEEIAFGIGATRAMQKARTVRPVVVLCRETLGHRFVNLDKSWTTITKQFVLGPDTGLRPFNYIFTKFDSKHKTRICQQFAHFKDDITNPNIHRKGYGGRNSRNTEINTVEEEEVFKTFVEDIVEKTTPEANVVLPMTERPQSLLRSLVRNSYPVSDPMSFFAPLAAEESLSKLQIQLDMKIHQLTIDLTREDYDRATEALQQLFTIAKVMPEAEPYAKLGNQAAVRHTTIVFHSMSELYDKHDYATAIHRIQTLQRLADLVPEAKECRDLGEELLLRTIVEALQSQNFGNSYIKLVQVGHLLQSFPKARVGIQRGLAIKEAKIKQAAASGEVCEARDILLQLVELAEAFPEATKHIDNGYQALQQTVHRTIEEFRMDEAKEQLNVLVTLIPHLPQAREFARNALRMLINQLEKRVDEYEYSVSLNLVHSLLELTDFFPNTNECVQRGLQIIWNIFGQILEEKQYIRAIGVVQIISDLVKIAPRALEYTKLAIDILGDRLLRAIQEGNYSIAMKMLLHMTKLDCDVPETLKSECVTRGLKMISQTADKAIKAKKYSVILELFHDLMELESEVPEAGRCARNMLTMIQREFEKAIHRQDFGLAIELLQKFAALEEDLEDVKVFYTNGQDIILQAVKDTMDMLDPLDSLKLIELLLLSEPHFFTAGECARYGLKKFRDSIEERMDQHDYVAAAEMWQGLFQLSLQHPKVKKTVQAGFLLLREHLAASLTEQNYHTATFFMRHIAKVERELPEADKCAKQSMTVIKNAMLSAIDQEAFDTAMDILHTLINGSKDFEGAFLCAQHGMKELQKAVETKLLDKKDYRKAIEMIEQCVRLSQDLPEALKCAQGALSIVVKAAENAIEQGDYGLAVNLLNQLHNLKQLLPEAHLCCQIALQAAIKHLIWLRKAVKTVVDQLGPSVPIEKFDNIVRNMKTLIQTLLRAEPMRDLCEKLCLEFPVEKELQEGDLFCKEQLKRLTDNVVSELLNIEMDKTSSTSLHRVKYSLLSTIMRLKVLNEHLYQCPGGDVVSAACEEAFKDFYVLLNGVLQAAETQTRRFGTTLPEPTGMEIFELQATFLHNIISGFQDAEIDISENEIIQIEDLERRREKMMHQFESEIIIAKQILKDFRPLKSESSFSHIQNLDLTDLVAPREALLAVGKAPSLCELLSDKPRASDYILCVKKFDLSMVDLMERIIVFFEQEHNEIVRTQKATTDGDLIEKMAAALIADIRGFSEVLASVTQWSNEIENRCRPHNVRLYKLKKAVTETLSRSGFGPPVPEQGLPPPTGGSLNPFQCFCRSTY